MIKIIKTRKMLSLIVCVAVVIFICFDIYAGDFVKKPWLQNVKTDSITIMWEGNDFESDNLLVKYGSDNNLEHEVNVEYNLINNQYHVYTSIITGLIENNIYYYKVLYGNSTTDILKFKTAPNSETEGFRFYALGDSRANPEIWKSISNNILTDINEYPEYKQTFVLNAGDIVSDGNEYDEYHHEFFIPAQNLFSAVPTYISYGNHEDVNSETSNGFLKGYFFTPNQNNKYFSFDYGFIHFNILALWDEGAISENSNQFEWLKVDLENVRSRNDILFKFALMHELPWSLGGHGEDEYPAPSLRNYLHPILSQNNVLGAFGGHNHLYSRYLPIDGVNYITAGSSGAYKHTDSYSGWRGAELTKVYKKYHYVTVDASKEVITVNAISITGKRFDYYTFGRSSYNNPPLADAGPDRKAALYCPVTLNGTKSEDADLENLQYEWKQIYGPAKAVFFDNTQISPTVYTNKPGDYLFELKVKDSVYTSTPDYVKLEVIDSDTIKFIPEDDTFVINYFPDDQFDDITTLEVDNDPEEKIAFLEFEIHGICSDILESTLAMYCIDAGNSANIKYTLNEFNEDEITYNTKPAVQNETIGTIQCSETNNWFNSNLTGFVEANDRFGIALYPSGTDGADFLSKETETQNYPYLSIQYKTINPPLPDFEAVPAEVEVAFHTVFNGSGTTAGENDIETYYWDFGDNTFGTGRITEHTFSSAGTYEVILTVIDIKGISNNIIKSVLVENIIENNNNENGNNNTNNENAGNNENINNNNGESNMNEDPNNFNNSESNSSENNALVNNVNSHLNDTPVNNSKNTSNSTSNEMGNKDNSLENNMTNLDEKGNNSKDNTGKNEGCACNILE